MICSLAYSATGNVSQSEDVAQETFLAAWTDLRSLREPDKLRAWLCGIVRNRIHKSLRREGREPVHDATPLEDVHDSPAREALPSEQAISREEEAILWRSLEKIPEIYREPLILFYREHQSIESRGGGIGIVRRRREATAVARSQTFAGGGAGVRGEHLAPDGAGRGVFGRGAGDAAVGGGLGGNGGYRRGSERHGGGQVGFSGRVAGALAPFLGIAAGVGAQWLIIRNTIPERGPRLKRLGIVIAAWVLYLGLFMALENTLHWLAHRFAWGDRVRSVAFAGFYWSFILATITLQLLVIRQMKAAAGRVEAGETLPKPMTPMEPATGGGGGGRVPDVVLVADSAGVALP